MRTASFISLTLLAGGLTFAAQTESAIYTGGNLDGIAAQSKVVIDLSGDKVIKIRDGRTDVNIPYEGVTKAEVAAPEAAPSKSRKLSLIKTAPPQILTVEYKDAQGEAKTADVQMSKSAVAKVKLAISRHNPAQQTASAEKPAKPEKTVKAAKKDKPSKDQTAEKADSKKVIAKTNADESLSNKDGSWWGDDLWKTPRNQARWAQQGGAAAQ